MIVTIRGILTRKMPNEIIIEILKNDYFEKQIQFGGLKFKILALNKKIKTKFQIWNLKI